MKELYESLLFELDGGYNIQSITEKTIMRFHIHI